MQYENEDCLFGRWVKGHITPKWSDHKGKLSQPKEAFVPPRGWEWDGDWIKSPGIHQPDDYLNEWAEDVFENQVREPSGHWPGTDVSHWFDKVSTLIMNTF